MNGLLLLSILNMIAQTFYDYEIEKKDSIEEIIS